MRSLGPFPGVLPLLDAYLPDTPLKGDPPWLAMPIATPIAEAVEGLPLEQVVGAVVQIASTLAQLAERRVGHRDVKPGNLYGLDGEWLVGDFGLVAAPEADDDITRVGKGARAGALRCVRDDHRPRRGRSPPGGRVQPG